MRHRLGLFLASIMAIVWAFGTVPFVSAEMYHGKVVDAETEQPLEGSVVVVVWYKKPLISMDGPTYFHDAKEVLTDAKGEFSLDGSPAIDWNPFTYLLKQPDIVIYKPGYGPLTGAYPRSLQNIQESLKKGAVVKLPRLKTGEEQVRFADISPLGLTPAPFERIPLLIQLINVQRKILGFEPIGRKF